LSALWGMCPAEVGRDTARKVDGAWGTEVRKVDEAWGTEVRKVDDSWGG
jgi:hypothetical protein